MISPVGRNERVGGVEVERLRHCQKGGEVIVGDMGSQPPMILSFRLSLLMPWAGGNSSGCSRHEAWLPPP